MAVKRIPTDLQCLLSASARVNSFKHVIEELVYNSLDSDATSIAIRVHIDKKWIQVVDNGVGIKKVDFSLLGERYATSKLLDVNSLKAMSCKYGYRGQALANIIEVTQTVKITSRCDSSDETFVKTFFEGKQQDCFEIEKRPSKGTTVEINGFLFNMNIQRQSINPLSELNDIKIFLESVSLVFNNVSFSLRDDSESEIIFKVHKNRDIYQSFKSLLDIDKKDLKELQVEKNEYKVKAYIGIKENEIKKYQWVYLNNKFMSNCNLHKLINDFFVKSQCFLNTKNVKAKTTYREEDIQCNTVPMYFIFISCPYYDYDIVYSFKQNTIEFKDWKKIKTLIEKLVKFSNSDDFNTMQFNKTKNHVAGKVNTKEEVKKIMEKILGQPNKNAKIHKMLNGIKGKQTKRRKQKKQEKTALKNTGHLRPSYLAPENIKCPSVIISKSPSIHREKLKSGNKNTRFIDKTKHKISKNSKRLAKCKCNKNHNYLAKIFLNNVNTIKRRCKELSSDMKDLTKNQNHDDIKITSFKETREEKPGAGSRIFLNKPKVDINSNKEISTMREMRSYDLLQTILKTQQCLKDQDLQGKDTRIEVQTSNVQMRCTSSKNFEAKFTFNSHKYHKKGIPKTNKSLKTNEPKTSKFLNKQSMGNFTSCKINIDGQPKLIFGNNKTFQRVMNKKNNKNTYANLLNRCKPNLFDTPFSIDVSGSDIIEFSKKIHNQIINDMNSLTDKIDNQRNQSQAQYTEQINVGFNFESTYTILLDSYQNPTEFNNMPRNCEMNIDETITKETYTKMSYYDNKTPNNEFQIRMNDENDAYSRNNFNVVFISEPQQAFHSNNFEPFIEPLDICEAVIETANSSEAKSRCLNVNNSRDSLFTLRDKDNVEINCLKYFSPVSRINVSKDEIKDHEKPQPSIKTPSWSLNTRNKDKDHNLENRRTELLNISNKSFNLQSRQNFLPKGMSQLFRNCFSKNICSYNMNTEYYEDIIYNNFVEDIILNTEVFEPKVQNIKDIASMPIQKATDNLKKNISDLVFGKESLKSAKVLGQVDCKFIAAKIFGKSQNHDSTDFFVLFDQHAVHERIRLENNLLHYFHGNNWKNVTIEAIFLKVSKEDNLYLHNHKDKFKQFGLEWATLNNCEISVHAIPEAIMGKNPRSVEMITKSVKNLIAELVHAVKYLKGNVPLYPQSIMNLVFSEACRYAIKFGDLLSTNYCIELIAALSNCKTPFQCAHGRPVMAVMMELKDDNSEYKVNKQGLMRFRNKVNNTQRPK